MASLPNCMYGSGKGFIYFYSFNMKKKNGTRPFTIQASIESPTGDPNKSSEKKAHNPQLEASPGATEPETKTPNKGCVSAFVITVNMEKKVLSSQQINKSYTCHK